VINQDLREHLVNDQRIAKDSIRVIPYGITIPEQATIPWSPRGIPVIGTVGRLEK
jgi:hypothetical protein